MKLVALNGIVALGLLAAATVSGSASAGAPAPGKPGGKAVINAASMPSLPLPKGAERFDHGRFSGLVAYRPVDAPKSFVLFLSGDEGWNARAQLMAQTLVAAGALVVGIDTPRFMGVMEADGGNCQFPDGDFENLSHFVQAYYQIPGYLTPVLAGYGEGGTLAYAVLMQSPDGMFAGALSAAFSPDLALHKPLCAGSGVLSAPSPTGVTYSPSKQLTAPWVVLQGALDEVTSPPAIQQFAGGVTGARFVLAPKVGHSFSVPSNWQSELQGAFATLVSAGKPQAVAVPAPADLDGLPVIEIPAKAGATQTDEFALLMSGDGGWAGLDKEVAGALSDQGIPVVGLDSLRYYWSPRTPDGVAKDVDKLLRYYLTKLGKKRALLIGYSQGADVLPFALNRLPAATRAEVALGVVMGLSEHALFEFHMSSWVSDSNGGLPTMPEVSRISGTPLLCIYGEGEDDSLCPKLDASKVKVVKLPGGHHFNGDYGSLAAQILAAAK